MSYTVTLQHDRRVLEMLSWAKENCPSYITNTSRRKELATGNHISYYVYVIDYHFSEERDATWFTLRWA